MKVYSYANFGYEGPLVEVETDLRRGIPSIDVVGLADGRVKETRNILRQSFINSNIEFPEERVLISLSPLDLKKDGPLDLAIATSILSHKQDFIEKSCLVLGELEVSGIVRSVKGVYAAVEKAKEEGITHIVCNEGMAKEIKDIEGIKVAIVNNLDEVTKVLEDENSFKNLNKERKEEERVIFPKIEEEFVIKEDVINKNIEIAKSIEIAIAGKHNILLTGAYDTDKTKLIQQMIPQMTPELTEKEFNEVKRIRSIAGLGQYEVNKRIPFRMPHESASLEGMAGGGINCSPGEITMAHNGVLFLDEASEFKSSVIQMLRVPLERKAVTLARAGRSTVYPADFQLVLAMNPCVDGNLMNEDRTCLDSDETIKTYWRKVSEPLLERIEIKNFVDKGKDIGKGKKISIDEMKERITKAYEIQRERGVFNGKMQYEEVKHYCKIDDDSKRYVKDIVTKDNISERDVINLMKVSLTVANMDGREKIEKRDIEEAYKYSRNEKMKKIQDEYIKKEESLNNKIENIDSFIIESNKKFTESMINIIEKKKGTTEGDFILKLQNLTSDMSKKEKEKLYEEILKKVEKKAKNENQVYSNTETKQRGRK